MCFNNTIISFLRNDILHEKNNENKGEKNNQKQKCILSSVKNQFIDRKQSKE